MLSIKVGRFLSASAIAIVLVLLFIVCFIIGLWVLMALTRIVLG